MDLVVKNLELIFIPSELKSFSKNMRVCKADNAD
jgi:hypothetical protein